MNKPIAILCLSNWGGISILDINDHDETVIFCWYDDEAETTNYYFDGDEAYFIVGETKYYFHEFMRV